MIPLPPRKSSSSQSSHSSSITSCRVSSSHLSHRLFFVAQLLIVANVLLCGFIDGAAVFHRYGSFAPSSANNLLQRLPFHSVNNDDATTAMEYSNGDYGSVYNNRLDENNDEMLANGGLIREFVA